MLFEYQILISAIVLVGFPISVIVFVGFRNRVAYSIRVLHHGPRSFQVFKNMLMKASIS